MKQRPRPAAVLLSGGADSAVLLAWALERYPKVLPVFIECGLRWENAERSWARRYLAALGRGLNGRKLRPLRRLKLDARDLLPPSHWARRGPVPTYRAAWDSVYLPGRNLLLLSKAAVAAADEGAKDILIGSLASNPFGDSRPEFFKALSRAAGLALSREIRFQAPFLGFSKEQVLKRGRRLPLGLTFSCIRPRGLKHCGHCTKCFERRRAFRRAGLDDPAPRV